MITPNRGVTKVCTGTRHPGCPTSTRSRNEARFHRARSPDRRPPHALTNQVPASDVGDMLDVALHRARTPGRRPGPTSPEAITPLDGSTLHRYADRARQETTRRHRTGASFVSAEIGRCLFSSAAGQPHGPPTEHAVAVGVPSDLASTHRDAAALVDPSKRSHPSHWTRARECSHEPRLNVGMTDPDERSGQMPSIRRGPKRAGRPHLLPFRRTPCEPRDCPL